MHMYMTETEIVSLFQEFHNIKSHCHFSREICNIDITDVRFKCPITRVYTKYSFSQLNFDNSHFLHGI